MTEAIHRMKIVHTVIAKKTQVFFIQLLFLSTSRNFAKFALKTNIAWIATLPMVARNDGVWI